MADIDEKEHLVKRAAEIASSAADAYVFWVRSWSTDKLSPATREILGPVIEVVTWAQAGVIGLVAFVAMVLGPILLAVLIWSLRQLAAPAAEAVLQLIDTLREELRPSLGRILGSATSELLGLNMSQDDIGRLGEAKSSIELAGMVGGRIFDVLEGEFAPDGVINPVQGEKAAQTFTGFAANFAVSSAFLSTLGELVSYGAIEEFRELGTTMANTLGLGRMQRRGLTEMVGITIGIPYEWHLNKKYRPQQLSPSQAIRAWFRQQLTDEQLHEAFARAGYSTEKMNALIDLERPALGRGDIWRLLKWGVLTRDQAIEEMKLRGWSNLEAELALKEEELAEAESQVRTHAGDLHQAALQGIISKADFNELVGELPLGTAEIQWRRTVLGQLLELPRRRVSEADMENSFLQGLITLSEYNEFLRRVRGYPAEDRNLLMFLLLIRAADKATRDARRREAEEKRKAEEAGEQGG